MLPILSHSPRARLDFLLPTLLAEAMGRCNTKQKALTRVANVLVEFEKMCTRTHAANADVLGVVHRPSEVDFIYDSVLAPAICVAISTKDRSEEEQKNDDGGRRTLVAAQSLADTLTHYAPLLLVHAARIIDHQSDGGGEVRHFLRWGLLAHDLASVLARDEDLARSSAAAAAARAEAVLEAICLYTNDALRARDGQPVGGGTQHQAQPMGDVIPSLVQWASDRWSRSVANLSAIGRMLGSES